VIEASPGIVAKHKQCPGITISEPGTLIWLTLSRGKRSPSLILYKFLLHLFFQRSDRGGIQLTTVNHSDIRGLVTA
jgi:hypothetical protein